MADDELRKKWERTESHLRRALDAVDVDAEVKREVAEFLEHNELGVAFEWLVSALADQHVVLSDPARAHLGTAAEEMGLRDDPAWQRLGA